VIERRRRTGSIRGIAQHVGKEQIGGRFGTHSSNETLRHQLQARALPLALQHRRTPPWTNNVEVDDFDYIYIVDRANTAMHTLELTGAARSVAKF
jgi:hypothetical protein